MAWIPHLMILDDEQRVLESFIPGMVEDLARGMARSRIVSSALFRGESPSRHVNIKVTAHGYPSQRCAAYRHRAPFHAHLHLVNERSGQFDLARRLLNEQLFAVVVSDLRFADDIGGQRAGQLFVNEVRRVHPEVEGLLYSAYPKPPEFPTDRFIRKLSESGGTTDVATAIISAMERHLANPSVSRFSTGLADLGIIYQSEAFGNTLAQLFDLARLFGPDLSTRPHGRGRRPLPCLLLDGESGTGKRALAELFHAASDRRDAPLVVASCSELTNETLLRSILFGHKRGAFTDARQERAGLVTTAGKGLILLDDFHRLPQSCSAILHSFLEDGEFSRLGEEETRRQCEAGVILTVETGPWAARRRSGELPLSFLARVERLPLQVPPLRERPEDIEAQARWIANAVSSEVGVEVELSDDAIAGLRTQPFQESNSRELRNVIERAVVRYKRELDTLDWPHLQPFLTRSVEAEPVIKPRAPEVQATTESGNKELNEWQKRVRMLAKRILAKGSKVDPTTSDVLVDSLFDSVFPGIWTQTEQGRSTGDASPPIPWPVWEDLWRCYVVARSGGPTPAERVLGIPANTLRQWISDRESR